jgi:hypothetical protein
MVDSTTVDTTAHVPTRISPPQHLVYFSKPAKHRRMAYGYIIDWNIAKARGETLWNTLEARQSLVRSVELSYVKHMNALCRAHWPRVHLEPVKFDGMIYSCITLADTVGSWNSAGKEKPPQEVIDKIKLLLETDDEPKWYKYYG